MKTINVGIIKHFPKEDTRCIGDYAEIDICIGGKKVKTYGDDYHDKGDDKASGFLDGYREALGGNVQFKIVKSSINDYQY